jgi:hypothetical protein
MTSSSCDKALVVSMASLQRNVMLAIFGMNATDRTHLAEISIEMSLREIVQAEDATPSACWRRSARGWSSR